MCFKDHLCVCVFRWSQSWRTRMACWRKRRTTWTGWFRNRVSRWRVCKHHHINHADIQQHIHLSQAETFNCLLNNTLCFFFLTNTPLCFVSPEKMARAIAEETQQLETDLNEERSRYQNLLTEHLRLEEKYDDLKEEMALSSVRNAYAHNQSLFMRGSPYSCRQSYTFLH